MAAVPQRVLNWLISVLTSEYKDVNRTYNDVAHVLAHHPSLAPRTEVYTFENGASALFLQLSGTLPVLFRGNTYRFPISVWVPHRYPKEAPLVYVTPTEGMVVRAGQHVDPQGKVYHPYLVGWAEYFDKSNILDFLAILRDVFAKEPPVVSQQRPVVSSVNSPQPPPRPPLPQTNDRAPNQSPISETPASRAPPPPPPKPTNHPRPYQGGEPSRRDSSSSPYTTPHGSNYQPGYAQQNQNEQSYQQSINSRYQNAPQLPHQPQRQQTLQNYNISPPPPSVQGRTPQADNRYGKPPFPQQQQQQVPLPRSSMQQPIPYNAPQNPGVRMMPVDQRPPLDPRQPPSQWQEQPPQPQIQAQPLPHPKPAPLPDLLSGPLTLPIPSTSAADLAPPPIPPNPEKDMLLHNIGQALYSQREHSRQQTVTSLPGLEAQRKAMLVSLNAMQAEFSELEALTTLLTNNTNILHTALHEADAVIESSTSGNRALPSIDDILVAPKTVWNQLYELVCEERSLGDALFVLSRAVERGRVSPTTFIKMTRSLSREWYLKKALIKKIGNGLGLAAY